MSDVASTITIWLERLKSGDPAAVGLLWDRFVPELVRLAQQKLRGLRHASADAEDVVLSVFDSFVRGIGREQFPRLDGRDDLGKILVTMTLRRAAEQWEREHRKKRGGGDLRGESVIDDGSRKAPRGLDILPSDDPTPELAAIWAEEVARKLHVLRDRTPVLEQVALMRFDGYRVAEIAERLGRSIPYVERRLQDIRAAWTSDEDAPQ
jgi:DNA-directed RNA polymerase specialized sigma24 family protein